jgi:hypothetical protein
VTDFYFGPESGGMTLAEITQLSKGSRMSQRKMIPIEPQQLIPITLEAQEWNTVSAYLMEAPWRIANPLLGKINQQAAMAASHIVDPPEDIET